jgi:hypothetical protein
MQPSNPVAVTQNKKARRSEPFDWLRGQDLTCDLRVMSPSMPVLLSAVKGRRLAPIQWMQLANARTFSAEFC